MQSKAKGRWVIFLFFYKNLILFNVIIKSYYEWVFTNINELMGSFCFLLLFNIALVANENFLAHENGFRWNILFTKEFCLHIQSLTYSFTIVYSGWLLRHGWMDEVAALRSRAWLFCRWSNRVRAIESNKVNLTNK